MSTISKPIAAGMVAGLLLVSTTSSFGIVRRHDVSDEHYRVSARDLPALANLPYEGHGALIAPTWVVTAAHAVSYMQSHPEDWFVTIDGKRRAVARIIVYPDYAAAASAWDEMFKPLFSKQNPFDAAAWQKRYEVAMSNMHDIALLQLAAPVTDVKPMPYYTGSAEAGRIAEIFGAGATGTDLTGAPDDAPHRGPLRRAENRIVSAHGPWLRYVFDCSNSALPLEGVIAGGDSGGPALINVNGQWTLAGVTHGLDGTLQDDLAVRAGTFKQGVCGQTFASTRISYFAGWIANTIRSAP
ncbi:MAG: trypsin-like serine protease [Proteobacteria bacterium]|nr:trypsin-like serine protease [Pseudomonadota bacterium]